jgi:hypothetical protein
MNSEERDSLLPLNGGLQRLEHLHHGLADLGADAIAGYQRDSLGFGIAGRRNVCDLVACLPRCSKMPPCQRIAVDNRSRLLSVQARHIILMHHFTIRVGTPTCCSCCHWGESPSRRLAERSIVAVPGLDVGKDQPRRPARQ